MSHDIPAIDLTGDSRKVLVNGRKYYSMTANKCTSCSGDDHFMFVKQKHAGGDVTIECPNCDYYITVRPEMINYNLNK